MGVQGGRLQRDTRIHSNADSTQNGWPPFQNKPQFGSFVEAASALPEEQRDARPASLETQLLHRFLPPVAVRAAASYAGNGSEFVLVVSLQAAAAAGAVMTVDHRGRIVYATSQLGALLGYGARQLAAMELAAVVPPPYSQLHAGFMKVCGGAERTEGSVVVALLLLLLLCV